MTVHRGAQLLRSEIPPIVCQRCGGEGDLAWVDITQMGDAEPRLLLNDATCLTPGCTWEWPPPPDPTPAELRQRADLIQQRMLANLMEN